MTFAETPLVTRHCDRPVAIAMALVVVSFSATLAISQWRIMPIEALALDITRDAAPGIEYLDSLRAKLQNLEILVNDLIIRDDGGASRANIRTLRHQLDAELDAFYRLPTTPEELAQLDAVEVELSRLDKSMTEILDEELTFTPVKEKLALHDSFHGYVQTIEASLLRLRSLSVRDARGRSDQILHARRSAMRLATGLGVVSWIIAVGASLLVMRALRGRDRLLKDHNRLIAERAAELEAFAGRVAHDLKSPLSAMTMRVHLIARRRKNDGDVSQDLDMLIHQVQRMDKSVDGMLEFARAGANLSPGAGAALNRILEEVLEELQPAAESAAIEIEVAPCPAVQLACATAALTSVLSNILGNAVKYSAAGTTRPSKISIGFKNQGDLLRIEIADTGPGLPPGAEQIIFQPFRRLSDHPQPGIGLGLATVKKIVEAYKGCVGVTATQGRGSVFWVELPTLAAERSRPPLPSTDSPDVAAGMYADPASPAHDRRNRRA